MKSKHNNIINSLAGKGKLLLAGAFLCLSTIVWAQSAQMLKGRIVDAEGNPIPGAVVNVAEQSRIALSDENGYFSLKNVKPNDELCISSVAISTPLPTLNSKRAFTS